MRASPNRLVTAALAIMLVFLARGGVAEETRAGLVRYVVRAGDSCWSIAAERLGAGDRYAVIHRHNDLGPLPHLLVPGQILWLPDDAVPPEARVGAPRHDVTARPPKAPDWRKAYEDMALWTLYRVATGDDSSALIQFRDASDLRMRAEALLVIHGGGSGSSRLRARAKTSVTLEKGTLRGGLARLDREAGGIGVETPQSEVVVRATDAQVEVLPDEASIVCVYEGEADVRAQDVTVTVPEVHGTRVDRGQPPQKPRPLPPPPTWRDGAGDAVVLVPEGYAGAFEARWSDVPVAARYRVELARDERFHYPIVDAEVGAGVTAFRAEDLALGAYYARVAAIDGDRLEGPPSAALRVSVLPLEGSRRLERDADGVFEVAGFVRLAPPEDEAATLEIAVDDDPFRPASEPIRLVTPGLHVLRYRRAGSADERTERVRVLAVHAEFQIDGAPLRSGSPPAKRTFAVVDERGRPVILPDVTLTAIPGGPLALAADGPSRFAAAVTAPDRAPAGGGVRLAAAWQFGSLGETTVAVDAPAAPQPAPAFRWPDDPAALEWARPAPGAPSVAPWPVQHVGLSTFVAAAQEPGDPVYLRAALRGTSTLAGGRVGLDADLPWYDAAPAEGPTNRQPLGDLRVGARWHALGGDDLALTPALRLSLPIGGFPRSRDAFLVEPGFAFAWRPVPSLTLASTQLLSVDAPIRGDVGLAWSSAYAVGVRPWDLVSLTGELGVVVGLTGWEPLAATRALAAGGALRFHLGRVRVSLQAGGGANGDGRDLFGRFTVGLGVDVGFGGAER